jgi:hypothetical protein
MELEHTIDSEDVRIDISGLLRVTWVVGGTSTITLSIAGTKDGIYSNKVVSLAQGRADALAAVSDSCSGYMARKRWSAFPLVWINGRFEIVEVGPADELQDFLNSFDLVDRSNWLM